MRKTRNLITRAGLAIALASCTAMLAAEPPVTPAAPATPATPAVPATGTAPTTPAEPADPAVPATVGTPTNPSQPPALGDATKPQISEEMRKVLEDARKQRADYQARRAELLKGLRGADAQAREDIRNKLKETREAFLLQQRENRAELRKQIEEMKTALADHKEVLGQVRETAKPRKGGDE